MWSLKQTALNLVGILTNDGSSDAQQAEAELDAIDFGDLVLTNGSQFYDMSNQCMYSYVDDGWKYQYQKGASGGGGDDGSMVCTPIRREGMYVIYDKTLGEILSAMRAGKAVTVIYDNAELEYQPFGYNGVGIVATVVDNTASNQTSYIYTMARNATIAFDFDASLGYNAPLQFYIGD